MKFGAGKKTPISGRPQHCADVFLTDRRMPDAQVRNKVCATLRKLILSRKLSVFTGGYTISIWGRRSTRHDRLVLELSFRQNWPIAIAGSVTHNAIMSSPGHQPNPATSFNRGLQQQRSTSTALARHASAILWRRNKTVDWPSTNFAILPQSAVQRNAMVVCRRNARHKGKNLEGKIQKKGTEGFHGGLSAKWRRNIGEFPPKTNNKRFLKI